LSTAKQQANHNDDPSNKIWAVYVTEASLHDKDLVERWKSDMDGILIFVRIAIFINNSAIIDRPDLQAGLFSASVTAFIVESYRYLQPDPDNTSLILLTKITQQLAEISAGAQVNSTIPSLPNVQSTAVRVNTYWFLSLVFGLVCALAATLVQQWSRNYLQAIERRPAPNKRGRSSKHKAMIAGLTFFGSPDPFISSLWSRDI
jgi:hypothetical protein